MSYKFTVQYMQYIYVIFLHSIHLYSALFVSTVANLSVLCYYYASVRMRKRGIGSV